MDEQLDGNENQQFQEEENGAPAPLNEEEFFELYLVNAFAPEEPLYPLNFFDDLAPTEDGIETAGQSASVGKKNGNNTDHSELAVALQEFVDCCASYTRKRKLSEAEKEKEKKKTRVTATIVRDEEKTTGKGAEINETVEFNAEEMKGVEESREEKDMIQSMEETEEIKGYIKEDEKQNIVEDRTSEVGEPLCPQNLFEDSAETEVGAKVAPQSVAVGQYYDNNNTVPLDSMDTKTSVSDHSYDEQVAISIQEFGECSSSYVRKRKLSESEGKVEKRKTRVTATIVRSEENTTGKGAEINEIVEENAEMMKGVEESGKEKETEGKEGNIKADEDRRIVENCNSEGRELSDEEEKDSQSKKALKEICKKTSINYKGDNKKENNEEAKLHENYPEKGAERENNTKERGNDIVISEHNYYGAGKLMEEDKEENKANVKSKKPESQENYDEKEIVVKIAEEENKEENDIFIVWDRKREQKKDAESHEKEKRAKRKRTKSKLQEVHDECEILTEGSDGESKEEEEENDVIILCERKNNEKRKCMNETESDEKGKKEQRIRIEPMLQEIHDENTIMIIDADGESKEEGKNNSAILCDHQNDEEGKGVNEAEPDEKGKKEQRIRIEPMLQEIHDGKKILAIDADKKSKEKGENNSAILCDNQNNEEGKGTNEAEPDEKGKREQKIRMEPKLQEIHDEKKILAVDADGERNEKEENNSAILCDHQNNEEGKGTNEAESDGKEKREQKIRTEPKLQEIHDENKILAIVANEESKEKEENNAAIPCDRQGDRKIKKIKEDKSDSVAKNKRAKNKRGKNKRAKNKKNDMKVKMEITATQLEKNDGEVKQQKITKKTNVNITKGKNKKGKKEKNTIKDKKEGQGMKKAKKFDEKKKPVFPLRRSERNAVLSKFLWSEI